MYNNKNVYNKKELMTADNTKYYTQILVDRHHWIKNYINKNFILNFHHTEDAIDIGGAVDGPQVPILQGKMLR